MTIYMLIDYKSGNMSRVVYATEQRAQEAFDNDEVDTSGDPDDWTIVEFEVIT